MKIYIERRSKDSMMSRICFDAIKPYDFSNDEWTAIEPFIRNIVDGKVKCYKDIEHSGFLYIIQAITNDNDWEILAESDHYYIRGEYEIATLYTKPDSREIACVGDFYGDPDDAYIDPKERFCITVGCGIIKYNLHAPYDDYHYNLITSQWIETGRHGDILWCDHIVNVEESFFEVSLDGGALCRFNLDTLEKL